ncbi:MAG TPA: aquaporin [Terriglobales bacterium]|nr:aquaporin [Terriglobales bacterium]
MTTSPNDGGWTAGTAASPKPSTFRLAAATFAKHWPEYAMEAAELGIFMISACIFTVLLQHPASPVRTLLPDPFLRRALTGLAMAATAIALMFSPWGKQSGAHFNPSVTLTFLRLKKIQPWDALFYVLAQFTGGVLGVLVAALLLGKTIAHPQVLYAATTPVAGAKTAFLAEALISFFLFLTVLIVSNHKTLSRYTGIFAGSLVALYITFESPLSGMSMNPARTFGSALPAKLFDGLWIYFLAPPIGMLLAAELYLRLRSVNSVYCAKYHHHNEKRCIFNCRFGELQSE